MDGSTSRSSINWAYSFDRALLAPSNLLILYKVLGTKALVSTASSQIREIERSYYHAEAYEYPIAVGVLGDGTEVLAHCPDGYNRIAIETLAGGKRLCSAGDGADDVFHSRLQFSPGCRYLLSAGWLWHPVEVANVYDIERALEDDSHLKGQGIFPHWAVAGEVEGACWMDTETLLISTNPEEDSLDAESDGLPPGQLGIWSFRENDWVAHNPFSSHTGTLHGLGRYALSLFDHPRLIDPVAGDVVEEWPQLDTGQQIGSIMLNRTPPIPPFALDASHHRFAVADGGVVSVVELDE